VALAAEAAQNASPAHRHGGGVWVCAALGCDASAIFSEGCDHFEWPSGVFIFWACSPATPGRSEEFLVRGTLDRSSNESSESGLVMRASVAAEGLWAGTAV